MVDGSGLAPAELAALVASRLCHDLVNPLGAIGNGVELLQMTGTVDGPEMALIADAVRDAQARVRFFRIAFGAAGPGQEVSLRETRAILDGLYGMGRLRVTWTPAQGLPRAEVKLAFLMLNCAELALPMGGKVVLTHADGALTLEALGPRVALVPEVWAGLADPLGAGAGLRPAEVQIALLRAAATQFGRAVTLEHDEGRLRLAV